MSHLLRGVLYTRVSTEEQAENGTSLAAQAAALQRLAAQLPARVVATYEEPGVSGGLFDARPGLQAALHLIESRQADVLLVYNISRLSRDREHQSVIKRRVEAAGGRLVFADMNFDSTPEGDLAYGIMGNFAHYERQVIRQRTMGGRRRRAETGVQPTRSRSPYGYHIVNHQDVSRGEYPVSMAGRYVVREDQAAWVREIFARVAAGVSLRQVCFWLEERAVPTPRGAQHWSPKTLHFILKNTVYKGTGVFGRLETLHDERLITEQGRRQDTFSRIRPAEQWVTFPVPALVSEETWEAANRRLRENRERLGGNPKRKFLLSSLVRCPVCGCKMAGANKVSKRVRGPDQKLQYYICHPLRNGCPEKYYPARRLEEMVLQGLIRTAGRPELVEAALRVQQTKEQQASGESVRAERRRLLATLEELVERERKVAEAQVDALMKGRSTEVYERLLSDLDAQKAQVAKRLVELPGDTASTSGRSPRDVAERTAGVLRRVEEVLQAEDVLTIAERQAILASVVDRVVPCEAGVRVLLKSETVNSIWSMSGCIGLSAADASASVTSPR